MSKYPEVKGHKVVRKSIEAGNRYWYYICECGFVSRNRTCISSARAVLEADHLVKMREQSPKRGMELNKDFHEALGLKVEV